MTGTYIWKAIPPYCNELRERVSVREWRGHRVLLESLEKPNYLIETDLASFEPDIPQENQTADR